MRRISSKVNKRKKKTKKMLIWNTKVKVGNGNNTMELPLSFHPEEVGARILFNKFNDLHQV